MQLPGKANLLWQPTYDTVQIPAAAVAQQAQFFTGGLGTALTAAVNKTNSDTNMVQNGRLDKGKSMVITALTMFVRDFATGGAQVTRADYQTLYNRGNVNLLIGTNTTFLRVPTILVPAGNGQLEYRSNIAPAVTEFSMWHGATVGQNMFYLPENFELQDQESIEVQLNIEAAIVAPIDVTFVLWGIQKRPVR